MRRMPKLPKIFLFTFLLAALAGCVAPPPPPAPTESAPRRPAITGIPPTFTPLPPGTQLLPSRPAVTVTQAPLPTAPTKTPVPFGETAVELRYTIPAINLDRRLQGGVNSQIILVDETTGQAVKRANQAGVLLELQQVLSDLPLAPLPAECPGCVQFSYALPFAQETGEGWLQDAILLASLDNYLNVSLGPHFPPGTRLGLYRRATPFAPAHTLAITEEGQMYRWLATEGKIDEPLPVDTAVLDNLNNLPLDDLADEYVTDCPGASPELLYLRQGETTKEVTILCPEFALPAPLLPLYTQLNTALEAKLATSDNVLARPPAAFPLDALLDYRRDDGAILTVYQDGAAVAQYENQVITGTVSSSDVLSMTNSLLDSGALNDDLSLYAAAVAPPAGSAPPSPRPVVIMRGQTGVYNAVWPEAGAPALAPLNAVLDNLLANFLDTAAPTEEAAPEMTPAATPRPTEGTPDTNES